MNVSLSPIPASRTGLVLGVSVALLMPVVLFELAGFQVSLTLFLAPLAGVCLFLAPAFLRNLFLVCLAAGVTAIGLATVVFGTFQMRYALSLLLMMTPPLYFFLGWYLCARYVRFPVVLTLLAIVSTVFVSTLALKVIVTGIQIRPDAGVLNLDFFGLPIYGSFGVLSLAGLFVLELFVIAAGFFATPGRRLTWLLAVGFAATVFLLTGSNARGPQLALPYLALTLGLVAWFRKPARAKAAILIVVGLLSATYSGTRMSARLRIVDTARQLSERASSPTTTPAAIPAATPAATPVATAVATPAAESPMSGRPPSGTDSATERKPIDFESLSSGRASLLEDAFADIKMSPIFGNGFASFGRVDRNVGERSVRSGNRTTHVQYLTALWKGGLLFFVPYMTLLGAFWLRAIRGSVPPFREDLVVLGAGLVFLFTILAFTWDILLVPSAGACAFFLLGAASYSHGRIAGSSRPERLLFMGFLVRGADSESIFKGESHPQFSALRFQRNLLSALVHAGATIEALTTPPIAAFPRNRHAWVPGGTYVLPDLGIPARQIATPNLAGIRFLARVVQFVRHGRAALREPAGAILVYSVHTPMVAAALVLKRLRGTPVFVFIPDLPDVHGWSVECGEAILEANGQRGRPTVARGSGWRLSDHRGHRARLARPRVALLRRGRHLR